MEIASWGDNVYVKIPVTNTQARACLCADPHARRSAGVKLNVTALMTLGQVRDVVGRARSGGRRATSRSSPAASPTPAAIRCR